MLKVAIADDEEFVLKSLKNKILMADNTATVIGWARNGQEAMQVLESCRPDIFFVDINMPQMDGLTFIRKMKKQYRELNTKFVIVSGYDDFQYLKEAVRLGVCDYLRKPVMQDELKNLMETLNLQILEERKQRKSILKSSYIFWGDCQEYFTKKTVGSFLLIYGASVLTLLEQVNIKHSLVKAGIIEADNADLLKVIVFPMVQDAVGLFFENRSIDCRLVEKISDVLMFKIPVRWLFLDMNMENREVALTALEKRLNERFIDINTRILDCNHTEIKDKFTNAELETTMMYGTVKEANAAALQTLKQLFQNRESTWMLSDAYRKIMLVLVNLLLKNGLPVMESLHGELLLFSTAKYYNQSDVIDQVQDYIELVKNQIGGMRQKNDLVGNVSQYLEDHFREDPSLLDLAEEFFVSPTYLSKRFKEKTGGNISQYIENLKMEHAKTMLIVSEVPVTEIALEVGYMDSNYFSRVFKKATGMTPRDFRVYYAIHQSDESR